MNNIYYWGIPDASVNFCENKYTTSLWIAEYTNTLTSVFYVIVGLIFLNTRLKNISYDLILLGISTFLFHMSIRVWGQILDEMSMIMLSYDAVCDITKIKRVYVIPLLLIYILNHEYFAFFILIFSSLQIYIMKIGLDQCSSIKKKYLYGYIFSMITGLIFWLCDQLLCDYITYYYYHALWHYFSAQAILFGLLAIL